MTDDEEEPEEEEEGGGGIYDKSRPIRRGAGTPASQGRSSFGDGLNRALSRLLGGSTPGSGGSGRHGTRSEPPTPRVVF